MSDDFIMSDRGLSGAERALLRSFAGAVIPPGPEHGIPGADDEAITADIVASAEGGTEEVAEALAALDALSRSSRGDGFDALDEDARVAVATAFRDSHRALAARLVGIVAQCYYRDERVMASLGMEPRPPYPDGFELEQGDWSLLDPVRARERLYR